MFLAQPKGGLVLVGSCQKQLSFSKSGCGRVHYMQTHQSITWGPLCVTRDRTTLHVLPLGSGHLRVSGRGSLCFSLPEDSVLPSYWHSVCFYVDLEAVPSAAAGESPETALSGSLRSL